jgi:hypothetical protein
MGNPLQRLSRLPWLSLMVAAVLAIIWLFVLEFFLWFGAVRLTLVQDVLELLLTPPLELITAFAIAVGVGALGVYLLEVVYPHLIINSGVLWALVLCLLVAIALKLLFPLPASLVTLNETQLLGIVLGVFIKGKPYWR